MIAIGRFLLLFFIFFFQNTLSDTLKKFPDPFRSFSMDSSIRHIVIHLNYQKADQLAAILQDQKLHWLSEQGHIRADKNTQMLWISDTSNNIKQIQHLITTLDVVPKQIAIHAKIVNVDDSALKQLGLQFHTETAGQTQNNSSSNINADSRNGSFTIPIATLNTNTLLQLHLDALTQHGKAKLIAMPKVAVINGHSASLEAGEEIPYQQVSATGNTNVAFKKAVIKLKVTPTLGPNNCILLNVTVNQDRLSGLLVQGVPAIHTQQLNTQALVRNNQTLVIGGMLQNNQDQQKQGIPILSQIPLLGKLFHHQEQRYSQRELLVFITPHIL